MQVFEGNGTRGAEIFSHGHFLKYLRFFIHGANLPERVKQGMAEQIGEPKWFTTGDHEPVRKRARELARANGLNSTHAEDFERFCCDLGLSASSAQSIGKAVKTVRGR
ncbi:MAG: hypothetical protein EOP24_38105 [Hyphomicrobiales bacterium]|nr:MAG: hypothetical protein EOP24_38105 [Hyphomicrobiales bacterium]